MIFTCQSFFFSHSHTFKVCSSYVFSLFSFRLLRVWVLLLSLCTHIVNILQKQKLIFSIHQDCSVCRSVHFTKISDHICHSVFIEHLLNSQRVKDEDALAEIWLLQSMRVIRSLLSAIHCDKSLMRDNTDVNLIFKSFLRHLQTLSNTLLFFSRDMLLCDVTAAVKVLCLSFIAESESLNWLSDIVEVWSVDLKVSELKENSLLHSKQAAADVQKIWRVFVKRRHCDVKSTAFCGVPEGRNLGGWGQGGCWQSDSESLLIWVSAALGCWGRWQQGGLRMWMKGRKPVWRVSSCLLLGRQLIQRLLICM